MVISGLGSTESSNTSITSNVAATNNSSASSNNANSSGGDGISLDLQYVNSVLDGTDTFTENSASYHLLSQLNTDILDNGSLAGVRSQIDNYTNSLASSNVYESVYSAPSASFLADLKALKSDAASGNLAAAATDLGNAKLVAPQYA